MSDRSRRALRGLVGLFLLVASAASADAPLEHVGSYTWTRPGDVLFGGFSALSLDDDGAGFSALSDRAVLYSGVLKRKNGAIVGVQSVSGRELVKEDGTELVSEEKDSEGMARMPDGRLYISFEGRHRIAYLKPGQNRLQWTEPAPAFKTLQRNSGMEALSLDREGRLITIPERSGKLERPFPVYRLDGQTWSVPYTVPRRGEFLVVGADTGPDGRLYVLERHFSGFLGFSSRLRSFAYGPKGLTDERELLNSRTGLYDNLEGISVWRDATGAIRITMISDDNYNFFQRTQFVEFRLLDGPTG